MADTRDMKKAIHTKADRSGYQEWAALNLDVISDWATTGMKRKEMAAAMGVHQVTLSAWIKKHPALRMAIYEGINRACHDIESSLVKRATGYVSKSTETTVISGPTGDAVQTVERVIEKEIPPDVKAIELFLKNRDEERWGKSGNDINITGGVLVIPESADSNWADQVKAQQNELAIASTKQIEGLESCE